jgi:hypothetical protein
VCSNLPSRYLSASFVGISLLGLLAQSTGTIGVLLAHGPPVGQVLGPIDNDHQCPNLRAIDGHVRVDARRVH